MKITKIKLSAARFVALATVLLSTACSTTYKVDPALVSQFKPETTPTQDETFVYVVRGSKFQGGARGAWLAANDKVVADLGNGTHTLLKLKSGINSIHLVQGLAGFAYAKVDNKPAQTIFMSVDYTTGEMKELEYDLGASMVMQTKKAKDIGEVRKNDAYDNLLANPALLGFPVMKPAIDPITPDDETAVINFYRMETLIGEVPFDIWSEEGYVGSTRSGTYFQVRVKPGKHTFVALSERYSVLEANVEAGKEYLAEFDVDMGWNQAHVQILPIDPLKEVKIIKRWKAEARLMTLDSDVINQAEFKQRADQAREYLYKQFKKIDAGEISTRELNSQHIL
ncbi:hypothetical protein [Shewanella woodyi]|uniref:hypothetical protein n=1 Tax=Shewanella woodyi TaxID=60961 RepID=UPI0037495B54